MVDRARSMEGRQIDSPPADYIHPSKGSESRRQQIHQHWNGSIPGYTQGRIHQGVGPLSTSSEILSDPREMQRGGVRLARVKIPRWFVLSTIVLGQVILSLTMQNFRILGLVQAATIAAVGLYGVLRRDLSLVICTIAYIAGTEVLWRQTRAPVFYLAAPYIVIILSVFTVILVLRSLGKDARMAVLYAALLLPASIATVRTAGRDARELALFALSGPLALATFVAFTSQVRIQRWLYRRVMWTALIGAIGPFTIAAFDIRSDLAAQGSIEFTEQSNFATSGGFGPVQVSSALSLGIMAAIVLIISERDRAVRILAGVLAAMLMVQTLLTFSRGGSFSLLIAMAFFGATQLGDPRVRRRFIVIVGVGLTLAYMVVFPWLEDFTGGAFNKRFSDTESARTSLAANDTQIFGRNFLFGVGPGMTKFQRLTYEICQIRSDHCRNEASSHTEFTRMLGEHGIPGVAAMVLLLILAWHAFSRAGPGRGFAVAWVTWAVAQMFYANLRIVAVPIAFGLAFLRFSDRPADMPEPDDARPEGAENGVGVESVQLRSEWRPDRSLQHMSAVPMRAESDMTGVGHVSSLAVASLAEVEVAEAAVEADVEADVEDLELLPPPPSGYQGMDRPPTSSDSPLSPDVIIPPGRDI